jgi:hypothetical protein
MFIIKASNYMPFATRIQNCEKTRGQTRATSPPICHPLIPSLVCLSVCLSVQIAFTGIILGKFKRFALLDIVQAAGRNYDSQRRGRSPKRRQNNLP